MPHHAEDLSMSSIMPAVAFLTAALAGAATLPAQDGGIAYAPGAHHYRVTATVTSTQDAGGQTARIEIATRNDVTVELTPYAADTLRFAITLDSSTITSKPAVPLPDFHRYFGLRVRGAMSPSGKVFSIEASADTTGDPDVQRFVEGLSHFLVPLPEGATVGSSWSDTTVTPAGVGGQNVDSRTITTSRILGDTVYAGQPAWRIQQTTGTTLHGMVDQGGHRFPVNGKGSGTTMYYVSRTGVYLGSTMSQTMTIETADGSAPPMTQTGTSRTELVR
jgi:hypothetical protein